MLQLAVADHQAGRLADAERRCWEVLALDSRQPDALRLLGLLASAAGQPMQAVELFEKAIAIQPAYADAWFDLGNVFSMLARFSDAVRCYEKAVLADPTWAAPWNNLGLAFGSNGKWAPAREAFAKALELAPLQPEILVNLAEICFKQGEMDPAIASFQEALRRSQDLTAAAAGLALAHLHAGQPDEAIAAYDQALSIVPYDPATASGRIYATLLHPQYDSAAQLRETTAWVDRHRAKVATFANHANHPAPDRPLRIGYVSADFRDHVLARNILPLLRERDRSAFFVTGYANVAAPDAMTHRLASQCDQWRNIAKLDDEQAAALVREDQIDILVDLSLHTGGNRLLLLARKPAPVQATFAGYPGGTGLAAIDWRITDPYLDPPGQTDADYVERSFRLPHCFWCYDPAAMERDPDEPMSPLPAERYGSITFGCLNIFSKVNDAVLRLWSNVVQKTPRSRLIMMAPFGSARTRVIQKFGETGVTQDRIEFVTYQARAKYLSEFARIDIGLDTFPYNGHTASLNALWSGVPVITRVGRTVVGRAGWSQLSNLGLTELAAAGDDQFEKIATELAGDLPRLAKLRRTLRPRMLRSPLTDARQFAQNVESAYRHMWRAWCAARTESFL